MTLDNYGETLDANFIFSYIDIETAVRVSVISFHGYISCADQYCWNTCVDSQQINGKYRLEHRLLQHWARDCCR